MQLFSFGPRKSSGKNVPGDTEVTVVQPQDSLPLYASLPSQATVSSDSS